MFKQSSPKFQGQKKHKWFTRISSPNQRWIHRDRSFTPYFATNGFSYLVPRWNGTHMMIEQYAVWRMMARSMNFYFIWEMWYIIIQYMAMHLHFFRNRRYSLMDTWIFWNSWHMDMFSRSPTQKSRIKSWSLQILTSFICKPPFLLRRGETREMWKRSLVRKQSLKRTLQIHVIFVRK